MTTPERTITNSGTRMPTVRRAASIFRPIDVTLTRNQLSSFDGLPLTPGLGYQLGLGGIDAFRSLGTAEFNLKVVRAE